MADLSPKTLIALLRLMRPVHWTKNLGIFAALVFSRNLFNFDKFLIVLWAFFAFNLAASAAYFINDIIDAPRDRLHPIKKRRPIASKQVPIHLALGVSAILTLIALGWALMISEIFFLLLSLYLIMQIGYSLLLKNIHIIDILIIASGFVIRVYSGAFIIDAHLSVWFLLCVISIALFLAAGKRRAELNIAVPGTTRKSLSGYSSELLSSYVTMFGSAAWISWALYSFFESPRVVTPLWVFLAEISRTASVSKLMMVTIPVTIFGIMRYQSLIFQGRSEAPEKLILRDKSLVISVVVWIVMVVGILYGGVAAPAAV